MVDFSPAISGRANMKPPRRALGPHLLSGLLAWEKQRNFFFEKPAMKPVFKIAFRLFALIFLLENSAAAVDYPVCFQDAEGRPIAISKRPERVVCLVPSVTELLFAIGAGDAVGGLTHHDAYPPETSQKTVVGGFFYPSVAKIQALSPDLIFVSDLHADLASRFDGPSVQVVRLPLNELSDLYAGISLLGRIFDREPRAEALIQTIKAELSHVARKVARIPPSQRKRVIRIMGRDAVMTPGEDSFQNQLIRLAGGIPPTLGKTGQVVSVSKAEWMAFNPEFIYGCGGDRALVDQLKKMAGWNRAEAVKSGQIRFFPCDLSCRLSSRVGHFVGCLASRLYGQAFENGQPVEKDRIVGQSPVAIDLEYVKNAQIVRAYLHDFIHKTLLLELDSPMAVSSTLEGFRGGIRYVGNSFSPPQCWELYHKMGLEASRQALLQVIEKSKSDCSLLFTGADMDHLSVQRRDFKEMTVYALVTAGVKSNALRMSQDIGPYYEPGTINMILLANRKLSPRAMNRAIISATEAKTAALWDTDIRSHYTPLRNPATGTGTDNIIVVQGQGPAIANAGGHSKMGELIAKAVYAGVREAMYRQNSLVSQRNVFQRLKERDIRLFGLLAPCDCGTDKSRILSRLEALLLKPRYAGFIETALSLSDAYERGLISDISGFSLLCEQIAAEIAGTEIQNQSDFELSQTLPRVVEMAFDALLNGIVAGEGMIGSHIRVP